MAEPLRTPESVAERFGVGVETVKLAAEIGILPSVRIGGQLRFEAEVVELLFAGDDDAGLRAHLWADTAPIETERWGRTGFVYFIGPATVHPVKVGWTANADVRERLADIQTGCWLPLVVFGVVPAVYEDERWCHEQLAPHRLVGEWFAREPALALLDQLAELREAVAS